MDREPFHRRLERRQLLGTYARRGFGRWGILGEYDVSRRAPGAEGEPLRWQHTSHLQPFVALREWLVLSLAAEHLFVHAPERELQLGGKLELAVRLAPPVTLVCSLRDGYAPATREHALTGTIQLYVKTSE